MGMDKKKSPFGKTVKEYSESTTIHGIGYIFENGLYIFERILWISVVILGIVCAIYLSVTAYLEWKANPVLTTVATTGFPIEKVEFPSITICAQGMSREVIDSALVQQFKDYLKEKDTNYDDLNTSELENESKNFLNDVYPNVKAPPNKIIEMMTSPNPTKSMENLAITIPEEEKTCSKTSSSTTTTSSSSSITTTTTSSASCPDPSWFKNVYGQCIKYMATPTFRDDAKLKCTQANPNSQLLEIKSLSEASQLYNDMKTLPNAWGDVAFDMSTSTFWLGVEGDSSASHTSYNWDSDPTDQAYDSTYFKADTGTSTTPNGCVYSRADMNSANIFEFNKVDCSTFSVKHNFFCMTGISSSASATSKSPIPVLPKFPCPSGSKRRKRQTNDEDRGSQAIGSNIGNQNDDEQNAAQTNGPALPKSIERLNLLLDPNKAEEREKKAKEARESYDENFGEMDLNTTYPSVFQLLWYSQLPCFDVKNVTSNWPDQMSIIKSCSWKGKKISCPSIFQMLPTDRGMCCSFNMKKAEDIFQKTKYAELVEKFQNADKEKSFENKDLPDWYKEKEPKSEPGQSNGLRLVLDAHSDLISPGTVFDNFKGFITVVGDKTSFPLTKRTGFLLRPGRENHIALSATSVVSDEGIRSIDPKKRHCYFFDEYSLELHKNYSQANCIIECTTKYARQLMESKCTPWYFPVTNDSAKLCNPWENMEYLDHMEKMPDDTCDHCLPDCTATIYDRRVSSAIFKPCDHTNLESSKMCQLTGNEQINPPPFFDNVNSQYKDDTQEPPSSVGTSYFPDKRHFIKESKIPNVVFRYKVKDNPTYNAYNEDITIANFYFDKSSILQFTRQESMTIVGYMSQLGGLLGLFLGFTFISAVELIYWFTIRLAKNMSKDTNNADSKLLSSSKSSIKSGWVEESG